MSKTFSLITDGLVKNNPTFVLLLGMCPTLATTTSAVNGLSMGLATLFVLVLSNVVISLIAPVVPDKVHIPVYIVVIATFVTLLQLLMQAFTPGMYETLGLFIPLIVVNCIVQAARKLSPARTAPSRAPVTAWASAWASPWHSPSWVSSARSWAPVPPSGGTSSAAATACWPS